MKERLICFILGMLFLIIVLPMISCASIDSNTYRAATHECKDNGGVRVVHDTVTYAYKFVCTDGTVKTWELELPER